MSGAERATPEATAPPSEAEMAAVLGEAYPAFQALASREGAAVAEWRRYSSSSPWVLKVSQGKRTLFYARPDSGRLKVTVVLGGRAVEAALAGRVPKRLQAAIREAKAFPEGRPVSVWIRRPADLRQVETLLAFKLQATARSGRPASPSRGERPTARERKKRTRSGARRSR